MSIFTRLTDLGKSFKNALVGIGHAIKTQKSLQLQLGVSIVVITLGLIFQITQVEWLLIGTCILAVIVAELINTAVERTVDLITEKKNKKAQLTKDVSAAAVLVISVWTILVGLFVFLPYL